MKFQLTIARKLFGLSLLAFVFLLTVGVAGLVARHYLTVSSDRMLVAQEVLHHQMAADQAHDALRADVLAAMLSAREIDQEERKAVRADVKAHGNVLRDAMQKLDALELDDANRAAVAKVRPTLDGYVTQSNALVEMAYSDPVGAQSRMEGFLKLYRQLESEMNALSELIEQRARDSQADSRLTSERSGQAVTVVIALASLVLLLVSWAISRSVVRRINQAVEIARTVATGDLSSQIEVKGSDEAAQLLAALARMNSSLVQLVGTVRQSSDNIAAGSVQIANGNQDLSQRTEEQASNLQQTAASMEQISAGRRAGPRLRRGGRRSAQPGAAQRRRRQGDQGADRHQRQHRGRGRAARGAGARDHGRSGAPGEERHHADQRDQQLHRGTDQGHRRSGGRRDPDRPGDAEQCDAGRGIGGGGGEPAPPGRHAGGSGVAVPPRARRAAGAGLPVMRGRKLGFHPSLRAANASAQSFTYS
jgi:HAMP domain-containing protein